MFHFPLYIIWNPDPNAITIGHFSIKWYGLLWGLALIVSFYTVQYVFRKLNRDEDKITIATQYAFLFGLVGARLAHIVFYQLHFYMSHPQDIPAVWKGGLASHGGLLGALLGLYTFSKRNKEFSFLWIFEYGVLSSLFLASLIRVGNLINSELYGKQTDVPWAFIFLNVDNIPRHPVVLYESIFYFSLQLFMLYFLGKIKEQRPGIYLAVFFTALFGVRFLLEFLKEPDGNLIFGFLSKTQMLNLPFIAAGIILSYLVWKGKLHYSSANGKV